MPMIDTLVDAVIRHFGSGFRWYALTSSIPALAALLAYDAVRRGWARSSLRALVRPSASARTDIVMALLNLTSLDALIGTVLSFGLLGLARAALQARFGLSALDRVDSVVVKGLVYLLAYDFLRYWVHRAEHRFAWWWELHRLHHSATELTFLTAKRVHPLSETITELAICIPLALLGTPREAYAAIIFARGVLSMMQHSMLPWRFGAVGRWLLVSPHAHRVHHSALAKHAGKNFGFVTVLWDRLFGTYCDEPDEIAALAFEGNDHNRAGVAADLASCYVRFGREVFQQVPKPTRKSA